MPSSHSRRRSTFARAASSTSSSAALGGGALLLASASLGALAGCTPWQQQVARRAAFDLGCPESELQVVELGRVEAGVTGCGCRATYVASGSVWVLNSVAGESCEAAASSGGEAPR